MNGILYRVAEETLENLAFLFAFGDGDDCGEGADQMAALKVLFSGRFSGELLMRLSRGVLPELAANMLGLEEEDISPSDQLDAASEALNIICGNLLPAIAGKQAVFNIGSPEILPGPVHDEDLDDGRVSARASLPLENGRCDLFLITDGDVPAPAPADGPPE